MQQEVYEYRIVLGRVITEAVILVIGVAFRTLLELILFSILSAALR